MRLFRVVTEQADRATDAKPGALMRVERYFAAESMDAVWKEIELDRLDEEVDVLAIIEHAPAVQVINATARAEA